ncbi:MAG: hypothetical protein K5849_04810 [Bacteroidales bacterium]|nr:hypothetical protein [Bacteroidales bacterium]
MSSFRKYGTCFFEEYARFELSSLLGREFEHLVDRDRPDLQSPDSRTLGIEVTRAMEESKTAARQLLKEVAGIVPAAERRDLEEIVASGYAYGIGGGKYIGTRELSYWKLAQPLRKILQSKVSKVGNGFYGRYDKMGLFVFCKDNLDEAQAVQTCRYVMQLQQGQELRYDSLYLADVDQFFACRLEEEVPSGSRVLTIPVTPEHRREIFLRAVRAQLERA